MPAKLVKFSVPDAVYDHLAARAAAHEQTVNEYVRARLMASLTAKQPADSGTLRPSRPRTVEPRWKQKDMPKAKA
jgi:plasmid stability protein